MDGKTVWVAVGIGTECDNPLARPIGAQPSSQPGDGGDETADTLGAPSPPVDVRAPESPLPQATKPDSRLLTERYLDPADPLPDYGVADALEVAGTPSDQVPQAVDRVKRNLPPPGQAHPTFGQPARTDGPTVADPVLVATGQFELRETDVVIPGPNGMELRFDRIYRSGAPWFGPFGWNWDHCYNVFGRELADGGLAVWTGELNEDVYPRRPDSSFGAPRGVHRRLECSNDVALTDRRYRLTDVRGVAQVFGLPVGYPMTDHLPLLRIEDRGGNGHDLSYDVQGRLQLVADAYGRFLRFDYGDCGLLESVIDHTGRRWRYMHDDDVEHLASVIGPPTPEAPDGQATRYEYDRFRTHPALQHGLLRVFGPAGQCIVENEYGSDPDDDFGRVVRQVFGDFEAIYAATRLQEVSLVPEAIDAPALRVEVIDPGVLHVYTFNGYNDLLDHRFRLVRDGSMRVLTDASRYDAQGNIVARWSPDGLCTVMTYDSANLDPRATGNLLTAVLVSPPSVLTPSRTIVTCTYEPRLHQLATVTDEAGQLTRLRYDIDTDPAGVGTLVAVEHPPATLPDGTAQSSVERFTYGPKGVLIGHTSAAGRPVQFEYGLAGVSAGLVVRRAQGISSEEEAETYGHDSWGNVVAVTDGSGARVERDFDALGRVRRTRRPAVAGSTGDVIYTYGADGQLAAVDTPVGQSRGVVNGESMIRQTFVFDDVGQLVETTYAANTTQPRRWRIERDGEGYPVRVTDPVGRVLTVQYDERHLVLNERIQHGVDTRHVQQRFDRGGRIVASIDAASRRVDFGYDGWGRLSWVDGPGGPGARTRTGYQYAAEDVITRMTTTGDDGSGVLATLLDLRQTWDERGRLVRRQVGGRSTTFWHDPDELVLEVVDERGARNTFHYDTAGRPAGSHDAGGDRTRCEYDARGLVTAVEATDSAGTHRIESVWDARRRLVEGRDAGGITSFGYDERDLATSSVDPSGVICTLAYDPYGDIVESALGAAAITQRWERDACGRVVAYTDSDGAVTRWDWTADDRWSRRVRPSGRVDFRQFDEVGEVRSETAPSGCSVEFIRGADGLVTAARWTAAAGFQAVDDLAITRDGAGRPVRLAQGTNVVRFGWDQHSRLTEEDGLGGRIRVDYHDATGTVDLEYPDGRVDRHSLDPLGRVRDITRGSAGTAGLTSYPPGTVLARYGFVRGDQLGNRELANATMTSLSYDVALRPTTVRHHKDGVTLAEIRYLHDAAGRRRARLSHDIAEADSAYEFDDSGRVRTQRRGIPGVTAGPVPTPTEQLGLIAVIAGQLGQTTEWTLSPAGAPVQTRADTLAGPVTERWTLDTDHAPNALEIDGPTGIVLLPVAHDGDGHRVLDPRFGYRYDAAGRLVEVTAGGVVVLSQRFDPLGRVVERTSGGISRRVAYLGSDALQETDSAGNALRQFVFGPAREAVLLVSDGDDHFGHTDAHASLVCVTDSAGVVRTRYDYDAFGLARVFAADGVTPLTAPAVSPVWAGHPLVQEADLYDALARTYDPVTGRFLQPDPRGAVNSSDPYAIAGGDPVDLLDPTGEIAPLIAAAVIIGAAFGAGYAIYDSVQNPKRYEGAGILKAFGFTFGGAAVGWFSAVAATGAGGAATLGLGGAATAGGAAAGGGGSAAGFGLLSWQGLTVAGVEGAVGGTAWRAGFHGMFPELEDAPSLRSTGIDAATGGVLRAAGPVLRRVIPVRLWNSAEVGVRESAQGMQLAMQGNWRAFGNELPLVRRYGLTAVRRWFWEERMFPSKSRPYWKLSNGSEGKDLGHTFLARSGNRQPLPAWAEGFRNAGFNLLELPRGLNRWLGNYMYREEGLRHALLGTLAATGLGSAALTRAVLKAGSENLPDEGSSGNFFDGLLTDPNAPAVTALAPKGQ